MKTSAPAHGVPADARPAHEGAEEQAMIRRFSLWACLTHGMLAISVFGLVFTGMPLKYSTSFWAQPLIRTWGGPHAAGLFHRGFAVLFFFSGGMHLAGLAVAAARRRFPPLRGPDSILPKREDARMLIQNLRFLRGREERPDFGKFTYWEKFDYLAEIWGLAVIGLTGLVMWFPEIAARYLPGWAVNAALIFHSYEALLAAAFIFSIHFFNTHLRPEVFPVDAVIFSGRMPLEEAEERYPGWYRRMKQSGKLREVTTAGGGPSRTTTVKVSAVFLALGMGMLLLVMSAAIGQVVGYLMRMLR